MQAAHGMLKVHLLAVVFAGACSKSDEPGDVKIDPNALPVRVDGSSTVFLVSRAVAGEVAREGVKATVNESGTTAGFKKLCRGEIDVSGASRPIEQSEIDECKRAGIDFYELPIGYDGLAVVVNRGNTWVDHLTTAELEKMWSPQATNTITTWKHVRDSFPDRPLRLFGPGRDSGTFDYFTQAIMGRQRSSRTDYTSDEDDTVLVRGVAGDENALGYFGVAYLKHQPGLRAVAVDDGDPSNGIGPVAPSLKTVGAGTYQPLSRPIFIYVSATSAARPEVDRFVSFYLQVTRALSEEVGYVPLRSHTDQLVRDRYKARRAGTVFGGKPPIVGVTIDKLLDAEPQ